MKRLRYVLVALIVLVFLNLTSCEKQINTFRGQVLQVSTDGKQMLLQTEAGRKIWILTDENTLVSSWMEGVDGQGLLDGTLYQPSVMVWSSTKSRRIQLDGTGYKAYLADQIFLNALLEENAYVLSDGTQLDVRRSNGQKTFQTKDGAPLLTEYRPTGPQNVHVGNRLGFGDLDTAAQEKIASWYERQGLLYDLDAEIARAYADYLSYEGHGTFREHYVCQEIFPCAHNADLIWFSTNVSTTADQRMGLENRTCAAFWRESGEQADIAGFFLCSERALLDRVLDLAGPADSVRREMEQTFRMAYVIFDRENLEIWFPAGSLASTENAHIVSVEYDQIRDIMEPWAIPLKPS